MGRYQEMSSNMRSPLVGEDGRSEAGSEGADKPAVVRNQMSTVTGVVLPCLLVRLRGRREPGAATAGGRRQARRARCADGG